MELKKIDYQTAIDFLLPKHYSGRIPSISYAFGWYNNEQLVAVCTFGKPASNSLCKGVCGEKYSNKVFELNRLCRIDDYKGQLSQFVSACLRELSKEDLIIVSYSDTAMNHHGYIYQATNFIYTGMTKQRTDKWTEGNKHSRHYNNEEQGEYRKVRSAKHRYIFFCTKNKKLKKKYLEALNYAPQSFPKGDNEEYKLGYVLKPKLVRNGNID